MICSAPSRFAAITPHRPTAPSPTTAAVLPGADARRERRRGGPLPITSESVSSDGISASSSPTGSTTSVPSACGTRTASPWPPSTSSKPYRPPCRQDVCRPSRQKTQVPSDQRNGRDDEVAGLDRAHVGADCLDDADELVPHPPAGLARLHRLVRPEIAAADRGAGDADERVGRLDEVGVGDVLDPDVAGAVHDGCAHPAAHLSDLR